MIRHARQQHFDLDWAQNTIESALRLYKANYFPWATGGTEGDFIRRMWSFIDTAFDDMPVNVYRYYKLLDTVKSMLKKRVYY